MRKNIYSIILLFFAFTARSQNLVQNPGFETYSSCPDNMGKVSRSSPWISPTLGSPDYYNSCSVILNVPGSPLGYQPARSGNAYVGGYLWQKSLLVREYVSGSLQSPLIQGRKYRWEMYVNLTNSSSHTTKSIGAYFSNSQISGVQHYNPLPYTPQVEHRGAALDTVSWTLVSGDFTANGGEAYVTIGNFKSDANTDTTAIQPPIGGAGNMIYAYALIDDVSLRCLDCTPADIVQVPVSGMSISPNPFTDKLMVHAATKGSYEIVITDMQSRPVIRTRFSEAIGINMSALPAGLYFYEVRNSSGVIARNKIVKP